MERGDVCSKYVIVRLAKKQLASFRDCKGRVINCDKTFGNVFVIELLKRIRYFGSFVHSYFVFETLSTLDVVEPATSLEFML